MTPRRLSSVFFFLISTISLLVAQQDRGTFTGIVTDPTGAAVPNVRIVVENMETGALYESQTNELGQYTIPNLPVGRYRLRFEAQGFRTAVREGVSLGVAQVVRIDIQLELGPTTESVTVTAEAPLLQTDTPEVGTSLAFNRIIDLPLSFSGGRYPEDFAYRLTPGVEGNNWTSRINGSPAFAKEVLLEGASATIYIQGHFGESSISMEAVEEFKVQTSGMSAEYGRTAGGVFNFVMKSGTNDPHGSAMVQFRNESLNANTFANNAYGRPRPRDRRHNWAVSFGGPIYIPRVYNGRNKTFFYTAYEFYKDENRGIGTPNRTVPTLPWYEGDMSNYLTTESLGEDALGRKVYRGMIYDPATTRTLPNGSIIRDPFPGNIIPKSRFSQVSQRVIEIMKKHYPPMVEGAMINNSFFPTFNTRKFEQKQFSIKLDHYISVNHKLSGMFAWVDRPRILIDQGGLWDPNDPEGGPFSKARLQQVETHMARLSYDWTIRPTLLNHLVLAFNRQFNPSKSVHYDEPGGQILGIKGIEQNHNFPEINWSGGDRVSLDNIGYNKNDFIVGTTWEAINTLTWIRGRHTLKFGFDYKLATLSDHFIPTPGTFNFSAQHTGQPGFAKTGHPFASFLLGAVASAEIPIDPPMTSELFSIAAFVQDDIKVTPRLTLNIGLRWEGQPQQTEWHDRLHNFNPNLIDPWTGLPGAVEFAGKGPGRNSKRYFYPNQWNDFAPRFGFAYMVRENMAIRGGYGVFFHGRAPNDWGGAPYGRKYGFQPENRVPPKGEFPAFNWDDGYPGKIKPPILDPSNKQDFWGLVSWDPDGGKVGYTQQWNFNIQFQLPGDMVMDFGYVGSKSTGLIANQLRQLNQMHPEALKLGDLLGRWISSAKEIPPEAKALGAVYPWTNVPPAERPMGGWLPIHMTLQPFPQLMYWNTILSYNTPLGFSTYHAFQFQFNKRFSHGIGWLANYTFSKTISNLESNFQTWTNWGRPLDYYNLKLEKSVSDFDITHTVKIGLTYELPFGRGRRFGSNWNPVLNAILGGWELVYLGNYRSGLPLAFPGTKPAYWNGATNRAVFENPQGLPLMLDFDESRFDMSHISTPGYSAHKIINTSIVRDPGRYELGNAPFRVSQARGFPHYTEDLGLHKNFTVKERFNFQLRLEALNAFNRHRFSTIETHPASPLFGQVTGVDSSFYRTVQVGMRVDF